MSVYENSQAFLRDNFIGFQDANVSLASAPVLYGLSIYTVLTVRYDQQSDQRFIFRLGDHWERLVQSARIMQFDDFLAQWDYERFRQTVEELLLVNDNREDVLIRVTVFIDEIMSGTRMAGLKNSVGMFVYPNEPLLDPQGAHLCVSSWHRTSDNAIPARAKVNGNYVNSALMKNEALQNGYDDAIALDEQGHVCESSVANIFLVRANTLITPHDAASLLEGITRRSIVAVAQDLGIAVENRSVDRSELYIADEIFLSGTTARLTPVLSVDKRKVGTGKTGPITAKLMRSFEEILYGKNDAYQQWLDVVVRDANN